ncbi:hypothetical protein V8C86DRAFT_2441951 [Haematococcus lacustris]
MAWATMTLPFSVPRHWGVVAAATGAGAGSLGKRPARVTLRGHARGLVAASPRKHGQTRVEEDEEKDDDGIFAKKRGRRASDNAPKSKGVSKGQDQGQKKSLKKGQVQGKEDAQEEGEEEGQEKEEEEGKEKGKGTGKKKEGKEVKDSKVDSCLMSSFNTMDNESHQRLKLPILCFAGLLTQFIRW